MIIHQLAQTLLKLYIGAVAILLLSLDVRAENIRIAVQGLPKHLDISKASDSDTLRVLELTSPSLLGQGSRTPSVEGIARSVSQKLGGRVYHVDLKKGIFHNISGVPIDAEYLSNYYAKLVGSIYHSFVNQIDEIKVLDEYAFEVRLKKPNPWFWPAFKIPIEGAGAYAVDSVTRHKLVLKPVIQSSPTLVLYGVKDPLVRYLKLKRGEVDLIHNDIPIEMYLKGIKEGFLSYSAPSASYTYLGMNLSDEPFSDVRVRKALSYLVDRVALINGLLGGEARPASSLLLEGALGYIDAGGYLYDVKKATQLLQDVGYGVEDPLTITLNVTTNPFVQRIAQVLQYQFKQAGVELRIQAREWGSFYKDVRKGNFEAYLLSWVGPFEGDFYYHIFHSSKMAPEGLNRGRLNDATMDALLDALMVETEVDKQQSLLKEIQQYQYENMLYIPLWRANHLALVRQDVKGYSPVQDGGYLPFTKLLKSN